MDFFNYQQGEAYCEEVSLKAIAREVGTPCFVYSKSTLDRHCAEFIKAFSSYPTLPCFAVKANSNLSILNQIFSSGFGADVVSVGEMQRALVGGVPANKIVFSGVGKKREEILVGLEKGILSFNVESEDELKLISKLAEEKNTIAPVSLRLNPNIDVDTNPYIATGLYTTKFGLDEAEASRLLGEIKSCSHLKLVGLSCHIGSQITDLKPFGEAVKRMVELSMEAKNSGHSIEFIDMGGGLGIQYKTEDAPPSITDYAAMLISHVSPTGLKLVLEPGRVIVGNTGVLLTEVLGVKRTPQKSFAIVDGSMTDLIRPCLYKSFHQIMSVKEIQPSDKSENFDVVGPVCESSDFLGKDRLLPVPQVGDLLYVRGAGAYGSTLSSNYNSRPRCPEVLVSGKDFKVIRPREKLEQLWMDEKAYVL